MTRFRKQHEAQQSTLRSSFTLEGIGVHSGTRCSVTLSPLSANTGIWFAKHVNGKIMYFPALMSHSLPHNLATCIGTSRRNSIKTVEHLLSALYGLGVDNALISVTGDEIPILDGSAWPFVEAIQKVGIQPLNASKRILILNEDYYAESHGSSISFVPGRSKTFRISFEIEFAHPLVGRMEQEFELDPDIYAGEISRARTFGFLKDKEALHKIGLALGASEENTIILDTTGMINKDVLRYTDEFVRHKICDAIGDLSLSGVYLRGNLRFSKSGHALNRQFSKWVFDAAMRANTMICTSLPQQVAAQL